MKLTVDDWMDKKANLTTINNPKWENIESSIRSLDGKTKTEVLLEAENDLSIGGGDGKYFVSVFTHDERSFVLNNLVSDEQDIELVVGGQRVQYSSKKIVDLEMAINAAKVFFETGDIAVSLGWDEE